MNSIPCKVKGCTNVHQTEEAVSPNASFICKEHPREVQVEAAGRKYNPETDEADRDVHFQDHQFDKDLRRSTKVPDEVAHIEYQGSDILTPDEIAIVERKDKYKNSGEIG
jgi:hypothetical protein